MSHLALGKYLRKSISSPQLFKMSPDTATAEQWFVESGWSNGIWCARWTPLTRWSQL